MRRLGTLRPQAPYDLHRSAWLLNRYHGVLDIYDGTHYLRAVRLNNQTALIRAAQTGTPEHAQLDIDLLAGESHDDPMLLAHVRCILAVDYPVAPFYAFAQEHPRLLHVLEPLVGLRHFQAETLFEAVMMVVIEQQISLKGALRAQRALAEWGGAHIQHAGTDYYTFPSAAHIATADHDTLHGILKITHRRVDLMQRIASAVVGGELPLEALRDAPCADAYERLMAIKGVGHWTAAWSLIRGAGCYDYVGHNDVALRDAVAYYYFDSEERVPAAQVAATFAAFAPYSGIAAFYTLMRWAVDRY